METFWLAETLSAFSRSLAPSAPIADLDRLRFAEYLYLLFSDASVIPLTGTSRIAVSI